MNRYRVGFRVKQPKNRSRRQGNIIIVVLMAMFLTTMVGLSLTSMSNTEYKDSSASWNREQAISAAEAGLDYAVWYLNTNSLAWPPPSTTTYIAGTYTPSSALASGATYTVTVGPPSSSTWNTNNNLQITSVGTMLDQSVTVVGLTNPTGQNVGVWTNALFGAVGESSSGGGIFHGNSIVAGSVHIHGDGVAPGYQWAISGNGNGGVYNNYDDPGGAPVNNIPSIINAATGKADLQAKFRIRNGEVAMGNKVIGTSTNNSSDKGAMAGVYAGTGSYSGSADFSSVGSVHADVISGYDLGSNTVSFPDLTQQVTMVSSTINPGTGQPYSQTYPNYSYFLNSTTDGSNNLPVVPGSENAYKVPGPLTVGSGMTAYNDLQGNSISAAGSVVTIHGIIWVQGVVNLGDFTYQGSGIIVSGGTIANGASSVTSPSDVNLNGNMSAVGVPSAAGFPVNVLAVVSMGSLNFAHQNVYEGAFFAENTVNIAQGQCDIVGSIVCSTFGLSNTTHLWYVPALPSHLPFGLPGGAPIYQNTGVQLVNYQML